MSSLRSQAVKGGPLGINLSANASANPSLNFGIVLRAAKAELKRFDLDRLPRTCTSSVLATGDSDAALGLMWALALHWYLSRIAGVSDKRYAPGSRCCSRARGRAYTQAPSHALFFFVFFL
jgi:hypothetical protein